jgi:lycopene cyclase domain-containing protein
MGLCLLLTLPLEFVFGARVWRRFRTLVLALLPEVVLFSIWDIAGIARHHWTYNPGYVTGLRLPFRMPVEELVFFLVVPICGVLTYEAVGVVLGRVRRLRSGLSGRRRTRA